MDSLAVDTVDGSIIRQFALQGELLRSFPLKRGHINDTYVSSWSNGARYVQQQVTSKKNNRESAQGWV
jgi:hypothetical protein